MDLQGVIALALAVIAAAFLAWRILRSASAEGHGSACCGCSLASTCDESKRSKTETCATGQDPAGRLQR